MLIRPAQIEAFASPDTPHFESSSIAHIKQSFPKHFGFLKEAGARAVVDHGRTRAKQYGLADANSVLLYIDLTLLLGRGFDEDIQLRWAASILNDPSSTPPPPLGVIQRQPPAKAERLHEYAMAYLDEVSGVNNEHIDEAQRRLLQEQPFVSAHSFAEFEQEVLKRLQLIWPQKYKYLGDTTVLELIRAGVEKMRGYEMATPTGVLFGIVAMYMLGSGFDQDPLFSWAARTLNDRGLSPAERTQRFYEEGTQYLKSWCALS